MNKEIGVYVLAAAVIVAGVLGYSQDPVSVSVISPDGDVEVIETVGGASGPDHYQQEYFHEGLTDGGGVLAIIEVDGTVSLTAKQMSENKVIRMTDVSPNHASATTLTLPATTSINWLKDAGDYKTWIIENAYTAAATTTTIAAGTGVDLQEPDGQNVVLGINNYAFLTCFREPSTNIVCSVDETIPAD